MFKTLTKVGSNTGGLLTNPSTVNKDSSYGSNVTGYTPGGSNSVQQQIAELGRAWQTAKPGQRDSIHERANALGTGAGGTYNPTTGQWTFPTNFAGDNTPAGPSAADLIRSSYENNLSSTMDGIRKLRDVQQQGLNSQETLTNQTAFANRDANDVMSAQALQRVREQQANQGINGGDSVTATLSNNTDRQNGANSINQDQANKLRNIMEQRTLINNNASSDELSALQRLQAERDQNLLGQFNTDRTFNRGVLESDRNFGRGVLESDRTFDFNKTTDQRNFNYTSGRDKVADQHWDREFQRILKKDGVEAALSWYNAHTSRQSSNNAAGNSSFQRLKDIWSATGKAPQGLEKYGVHEGDPYQPNKASKVPNYDETPDWGNEITLLNKDPKGSYDDYIANPQEYIDVYGYKGYNELLSKAKALINFSNSLQ